MIPQHTELRTASPELSLSLLFGRKGNEPALGSQSLGLSGRVLGPKYHDNGLLKECGNFFQILLHVGGLV